MEELKILDEIMGLVNQGFEELQNLQVQPIMSNVKILYITMMNMAQAFSDCKKLKEKLQKILGEMEAAKQKAEEAAKQKAEKAEGEV